MPISNTNPWPKDVVIIQRDDLNSQYNETHISASDVILYIDSAGHINADHSASFYALYPVPTATSASWASASIFSTSGSWSSASIWSISGSEASHSISSSYAVTASSAIQSYHAITASSAIEAYHAQTASSAISSFNAVSSSWASQSLSTSYFITSNNPLPVDQRTVVADQTARDSIPLSDRYQGLTVWVVADSQAYTLIGGINNSWWVATPLSASWANTASIAITASFALNGGSGGSANLNGVNQFVPTWWNNSLTSNSLIYATSENVGVNTENPNITDTLTVAEVNPSNVLWNPTLLSIPVRFWYRADDINLVSGSFVDVWPDASPYKNNATASGPTTKPQLIYGGLNGYPAVRFDGVNDGMHCITPASVTASVVTAFVVAKVASYSPSFVVSSVGTIIGNSHTGLDRDFVIGEIFDGGISKFVWTVYTENTQSAFGQETPIPPFNAKTNEWYINTVFVSGSNSYTNLYLSGSTSGSGLGNQSTNLDLRDLYIGYETASNLPFNGDIAEIIICTQSLSTSDIQKVEGYLAWKYGLQTSLSGSHPYRNSMPIPSGRGNVQVWEDFNNNILAYLSSSGILYATASNAITASYVNLVITDALSASWASQSLSSSYSLTASSAIMSFSSSYAISASWSPPQPTLYAVSASYASASSWSDSSSYASQSTFNFSSSFASRSLNANTASWGITSSYAQTSSVATSASVAVSSSWALTASYSANLNPNAISASWASQSLSASFATTASYATNLNPNAISASWASQSVWSTTASYASKSISSSFADSSSWAVSASWAPPIASDYAVSASYASASSAATSASWASRSLATTSASYASSSTATTSASYASQSLSASYAVSASWAPSSAGYATSASWASQSLSASWAPTVGLSGTDNYVPKWLYNNLTTASLIYDTGIGVGINATSSQINAAFTVKSIQTASAILWDPSYSAIPMRVWLRGDDITGSQSSSVALWPDTSSYGNYFTQSVGGNQPLLFTSSLNGHSIIHFDGTNDYLLSISGSTSIVQTSLCAFAVAKPTTFPVSPSAFSNATVISNGHSGNSRDFTLGPRIFGGVPEWNMYNESTVASFDINALANISRSWYIVNGNVNGANSLLTVYINSAATSSGVVNGSSNIDLRDLYVGYETNFGQPFQGEIAEIILTTQVLPSADQRKVEGYLAWKYNLVSNLPSDHPYINAPPYVLDPNIIQSWQNATGSTVSYVDTSGSYVGTASFAVSASWSPPTGITAVAVSASWASQSLSSSFATTASYSNPGVGVQNYYAKWGATNNLLSASLLFDNGTYVQSSGSVKIHLGNSNFTSRDSGHLYLNNQGGSQTSIYFVYNGTTNAGKLRSDSSQNVILVSYANNSSLGHFFNVNGDTDVGQTKQRITIAGVKFGYNISSDPPTALVNIAASDGTAGKGQLKFDSSTLLTVPETGVVEFQGDKWYATIGTGPTRKELAINDLALTSGSIVTSTVNGRLANVGPGIWNITASNSNTSSYSLNTTITWVIPGWYQYYISHSLMASSGKTLPSATQGGMGALVGNVVYLYGGYNAGVLNTIWTSSADASQIGLASGYTLPVSVFRSNCVRIGNDLFIFGGATGSLADSATGSIQTASLNDPLTWTASGSLPFPLSNHSTFVVNGDRDIYLVGGITTGGATNNQILYATASNPFSWSVFTPTWVGGGGYQTTIAGNGAVIGGNMCMFGGWTGPGYTNINTQVFTASVSNPLVWNTGNVGITAPAAYINNCGVIIGNYYYTFGGHDGVSHTGKINRAEITTPGVYVYTGQNLPATIDDQVAIVSGSGRVFLYGGYNGASPQSTIYSASIINLGAVNGDQTDVSQNESWSYVANYFVASVTQSMTSSWAVFASQSLYENVVFDSSSNNYDITFVSASAGFRQLRINNSLSFNPSLSTLTVPFITSSWLFGTASWAANAITASNANSASWAITASYSVNVNPNADSASYASKSVYSVSSSWASASIYSVSGSEASHSISSSYAISASWAPLGVADFAISASFASASTWADSSSFASSSISSSYVPVGRSIVLCSAYTPTTVGADTAEVTVPYSPLDGFTPVTWSVRRLSFRVQSAESVTSSINIEKSSVTGAFSAVYLGSILLSSGSFETASITTGSTISGDKIRFNATIVGTSQNWTVITELSR